MGICQARLHTQRHDGREFTFQWRRWQSYKLPFTCDVAGRSAVGDAGAVCRTLNRWPGRWWEGMGRYDMELPCFGLGDSPGWDYNRVAGDVNLFKNRHRPLEEMLQNALGNLLKCSSSIIFHCFQGTQVAPS